MASRVPVHVEVVVREDSTVELSRIRSNVLSLMEECSNFSEGPVEFESNELLAQAVLSIRIVDLADSENSTRGLVFWQLQFEIHVFQVWY